MRDGHRHDLAVAPGGRPLPGPAVSGTANGMPKDSTTWLSTRPPAGLVPVARMVSAGIMVIARRARQGDAEADESGHDDLAGVGADAGGGGAGGQQATANASPATPPASLPGSAWAWPVVARPDSAGVCKARGGDGEHRHVHQAGQAQGDEHVQPPEPEHPAALAIVAAGRAASVRAECR